MVTRSRANLFISLAYLCADYAVVSCAVYYCTCQGRIKALGGPMPEGPGGPFRPLTLEFPDLPKSV